MKLNRHVFIINPQAGKKKGRGLIPYIKKHYKEALIFETEYPGHASLIAKKEAIEGSLLYSVGGDGTLNEVINGVLETKNPLSVAVADVPCGSGNDFLKGLTQIKDCKMLLRRYKKQIFKTIDVGCVNGRYFLNIASIGFDAEVVMGAKRYKRLPMFSAELAYLFSVFARIINLRHYPVKIQAGDQKPWIQKVLFITLANGSYYGGGMKAAPRAKMTDGLFDFCVISQVKRRQVPILLPLFMKGKHEKLAIAYPFRGKTIQLTSEENIPLNIDGEVMLTRTVQGAIKEQALRIVLPS